MKNLILTGVFLLLAFHISAQDEKREVVDSVSGTKHSYALARIRYVSDAVFMGRKDSIAAPYVVPQIAYFHRSGLFFSGSFSYLTAKDQGRIDLFLLSMGYDLLKNSWSGGLSATQYFFNDESYTVNSQLSTDLSAYLGYDFYFLEVYLDGSVYFSADTQPDIIVGGELSRTFYAIQSHLKIIPSVYLNAGSQNYYEAYYQNVTQQRKGNQKGKGAGQSPPSTSTSTTTVEIKEASKFSLLDIELSLPLSYNLHSFRFSFTPTLAFPLGKVTLSDGQETFEEELENTFYWSVGLGYRF